MMGEFNVLKVGATRQGKTLSAARDIVEAPHEAAVILDPHKDSLGLAAITHADGNLLYDKLSFIKATLGFELLSASRNPDLLVRELENQRRAEAFEAILLRPREKEGMAGAPLMSEWTAALLTLFLFQVRRKPLEMLPFGFRPGTKEFEELLRDCPLKDIVYKFRQLATLTPRGLRSEVGSAERLINGVFNSLAFRVRSRGDFDLGKFLQGKGKLIVERGEDVGDDTMRVIMGAIILLVIEHAKRRPKPYPPIRIYIDEAVNARLVGPPELRGLAETNKNGLFWTLLVQNLNFPGNSSDEVLQNSLRHEWFKCPVYELARKAATDVASGLPRGDISRAELIANLTDDIMNLSPGWRWVRDPSGSRKEYVPLLTNPWPDWPGLRDAKLKEKLCRIYARPEYQTYASPKSGDDGMPPSSSSSPDTPPRPSNSPESSSPAERWRLKRKKPVDGSSGNENGSESA